MQHFVDPSLPLITAENFHGMQGIRLWEESTVAPV